VRLRGLFNFTSVLVGDALLLPIAAALTALLNRLVDDFLRSLPGDCNAALVAQTRLQGALVNLVPPLTAGILTVGLHLIWLGDPGFVNWTVPVPGHLNAAGWYHAMFVWVLMWWFFAGILRMSVGIFPLLIRPGASRKRNKSAAWRTSLDLGNRNNVSVAIAARVWVTTNLVLLCLVTFSAVVVADYSSGPNSSLTLAGYEWNIGLIFCLLTVAAVQVFFAITIWFPITSVERREYHLVDKLTGIALELRRQFQQLLVAPLVVLLALSLPAVWWALHILGLSWPVAFCGLVLPFLFAESLWSELYHQQNRRPGGIGTLSITATFLGSSASLLVGLAFTLESQEMVSRLSALFAPWWRGLTISFIGILSVGGLATCLCSLEEGLPNGEQGHPDPKEGLPKAVGGFWTPVRPRNDLLMNYAQFWGFHQFIIITAVLYVSRLQEVMNAQLKGSDIISLLYGFTGLTAVGVMLPLRTNVSYIEQQEKSDNTLRHNDIQHSIIMSLVTGMAAIGIIVWLWLSFLTSILG
jgi:hypothetical protein